MKNWIEPIRHSSICRIVESVQLNFIFFLINMPLKRIYGDNLPNAP